MTFSDNHGTINESVNCKILYIHMTYIYIHVSYVYTGKRTFFSEVQILLILSIILFNKQLN